MQSPFNLAATTVYTASQWILQWTWPAMTMADAETISAWVDSLNGAVGTFTYGPRQSVTSTLTGKTLGAIGYGYATGITIAGFAANAATTLRAGQFFQIGNQLLRITAAPLNANGAGAALVEFQPPLRQNYASGTAVNFTNPKGLFRVVSGEAAPGSTVDPNKLPEFNPFSAQEAI